MLLFAPAFAAPSVESLRAAVATYDAGAAFPIGQVSPADLAELAAGRVVKIVRPGPTEDAPVTVIGLLATPLDRAAIWVSCQDPHFDAPNHLVQALVSHAGLDQARWYAYLDVPSPFSDREWVVDVWNNHALARSTGDAAWEHPWKLDPLGVEHVRPLIAAGKVGSVSLEMLESAVYTPDNEGAWLAVRLPDGGTLLGYQVRSTVGGGIPDWMFTRYVVSTLEDLLHGVEDRARTRVTTHYVAGHRPIYAGSGEALPTF